MDRRVGDHGFDDQTRRLMERWMSDSDDRRRDVARVLLESVCQQLAAFGLAIRVLGDAPGTPAEMLPRLEALRRLAQGIEDEVGGLSHSLWPCLLEDLGLGDTLRQQVGEFRESTGVDITLHLRGMHGASCPSPLDTTIFRLLEDSLDNVRLHAQAHHVTVIVEKQRAELRLVVEDDGLGFDPEGPGRHTPAGGGLGLRGMRERAAMAGGQLDIESTPGQGTTMFVTLPIETEA